MGHVLRILTLFAMVTIWGISGGYSQTPRVDPAVAAENAIKERKNAGTVGLACGQLGGAYPTLAEEISKVLADGDNLRIIPMLTQGSVGNVEDLLYLRNVDVALTKSESLDTLKQSLKVNIKDRIRYVARLYDSELHILARPEIRTIQDLKGKKVNLGLAGNAAHTTVPIVMKELGIDVEMLKVDFAVGLDMMKKGEVAATMRVVGKPGDTFTKAPTDAGFHFLSISTAQYAENFADKYVIGRLTNKDYPKLIPEGETINTVAVPELLAVYNWPRGTDRYLRVEKFIVSFFKNFHKLRDGPFHEKWKDVNLAATVPGWTRSEIAERMLKETGIAAADPLATGSITTAKEREALFQEFMKTQSRTRR
ncbi:MULTISPECIES: TAXI family TRAP transporter solute-binding subunit [Rhodomicrobium]|uniref:TAXI family TRAP transporter solute-binding subunit n=1 Tax=Rhodomicrobium TaxID=1068 RepID=UPI001481E6F4|nr:MULTISPECIES: TAXI family TRAP transporter solute-binding subunit [Rhodomicrobium]